MAYTLEQYNALQAAIAQGATRVKYADKEVEYRSLDEMRSILREMGLQLGFIKPSTRLFAKFNKGLNECD